MPRRATLRVRLDYPGARLESLRWPELRDFVNALAKALKAMAPGADIDSMIPLTLEDGCIQAELAGDQSIVPAYQRLRKGPTKSWSATQWAESSELWGFLRRHEATMKGSFRGELKLVVVPDETADSGVVQGATEFVVYVERVGGVDPRVVVQLLSGERCTFDADRELVHRIGGHVYTHVKVFGDAVWLKETIELKSFRIRHFEEWKEVHLRDVMREHGRLPIELSTRSVSELIRHREEDRHDG